MTEETIAAIATASGRAGLAIVRVSGPEARSIARGLGFEALQPRRATYGGVRHPESGVVVDRAVVTWFAGPASYTGEDVIELACHGGHLAPRLVLDAALAAGARRAERGEFTRRAFLNGKLDLVQVEATLDLVDASTEALGRAAMRQLEGGLSRRVERLRKRLVRLQAMLGYEIDFPEEDEGPIPPERIDRAAASLAEELDGLLRHAPEGELLREGALTVIAGRPNSGKSSLFNALLGSPRAIVTELPGTTRDAVEALVSIEGYPFRLVDTAGLREEPGYVERIGIEVARGYLERADLVLLCAEAGRRLETPEEELLVRRRRERREILTVRTKADLAGSDGDPTLVEPAGAVRASVRTGEGLERVRKALLERAYAGLRTAGEAPFLVRRRQVRAVREARGEVEAFREARRSGLPAEIAAVHLRDASSALEALLGAVDRDEILEALFRSFCVGK